MRPVPAGRYSVVVVNKGRHPHEGPGMHSITMFDSTKESLQDLLRGVREGKTQLPDFQRGWVWDDEHIRSLLASVSMSYPIGAVMMLQTGNPDVRFKPRPAEDVSLAAPTEPERLILDGQQRLTSLFQALFMGQPVLTRDTRGKPLKRWYYVDIRPGPGPRRRPGGGRRRPARGPGPA